MERSGFLQHGRGEELTGPQCQPGRTPTHAPARLAEEPDGGRQAPLADQGSQPDTLDLASSGRRNDTRYAAHDSGVPGRSP